MSLKSHDTNFLLDPFNATWKGDLYYLLKVAENNPLRLDPTNANNLKVHIDSKGYLAIGYGYDLAQNKDRAKTDLAAIGINLTSAQETAINNLVKGTAYTSVPVALTELTLGTEKKAEELLGLAVDLRLGDGTKDRTFSKFMEDLNIILPDSREKAVLMSMWYQGEGKYFGTVSSCGVRAVAVSGLSFCHASGNRR